MATLPNAEPTRPVTVSNPALRDPAWRGRVLAAVAVLLLLAPLLHATEFKPWLLADARSLQVSGRFLASFWPPAHGAEFLGLVAQAAWRTVAIATAGMALALLLALPLTLLATRALSLSALADPHGRMATGPAALRRAVRWLLVLLRSVPELVWALVFVRVAGLGPTAGVLAIALTYGGMLGKVYGEILESGDQQATRALLHNGSGRLQAFAFALLPQNASELSSYTVYRWECAVRSSVVLGLVGAGGLGQLLDGAMKMFNGGEVLTLLAVFVALVALADRGSAALRNTGQRGLWLAVGLVLLVLLSFATLELQWAAFFASDGLRSMGRFIAEFVPPDLGPEFLLRVAAGAWETLAMSALGTLLAAALGLALALPASRLHARDAAPGRGAARWLLNALRAVPELVWAALLVVLAGLGPFAGTLALAVHTTGVLGRLFAEAVENAPAGPGDALRAQGIGRLRVFLFASLPQVLPQLLSYTLYRWENNIRAAAVLGVVGAGGLGQLLAFHLGLFHMGKTATVLLAMLVLVAVVDGASHGARRLMTR